MDAEGIIGMSIYISCFRIICIGLIAYVFVASNYDFIDDIPDDPFNNNKITSFNNYLYSNKCQCNNETINGICTKEQELLGCTSFNTQNDILRKLQEKSECYQYSKLISEKTKISEIFDLNLQNINLWSFIQLILLSVCLLFNIFIIIYICCSIELIYGDRETYVYKIYGIFSTITEVARFVFMIFFWVNYTKSQIPEYLDILECPDIYTNSFVDYPVIDKIDDCIISFLVFNTYSIINSAILGLVELCDKCDVFINPY